MAPLIAKGKVIMGTSGPGEMGIRGFVDALNADTGASAWKVCMVPGQGEVGVETWAGDSWKYGGGLAFVGTWEGKLVGLDNATRKQLWSYQIGTPVTGPPITYAVGGKQYVAVIGGGKTRGLIAMAKEPKLAEHSKKSPLDGILTVFGLPD